MTTHTDDQLLSDYRSGNADAFAEIVRRHIDWIHGVARRRVGGDLQLAEDVTQATFLVLAQKSAMIRPQTVLPAWLFRVACYLAARVRRTEARRARHEAGRAMIQPELTEAEVRPDWQSIAPMIDEFVGRLRQSDREAILLRFYRKLSFAQVGEAMQISEDAARKRVTRALNQLRAMVDRRGLTLNSAALGATLATGLVATPAPAGSVALVTTAAHGGSSSAAALSSNALALAKGALTMSTSAKLMIGAAASAALCTGTVCAILATAAEPQSPAAAAVAPPAASQPTLPMSRVTIDPGTWTKEMNDASRSMKIACFVIIGSVVAEGGISPGDLGGTLAVAEKDRTAREIAAIYLTPADLAQTQIPERIEAAWINAHASYVYLAGSVPLDTFTEDAQRSGATVMFHTKLEHPLMHPRDGDCILVAFMDGHVEAVKVTDAKPLIERSKQSIETAIAAKKD